jgi:hypothetical protein
MCQKVWRCAGRMRTPGPTDVVLFLPARRADEVVVIARRVVITAPAP